ncbi:MAG: phosphoenolpyruvate--protein phosphotransferase [Gemmataceae bacterium]|nr:phosphoenolpyruvate--protein phosphotransferase [Gemmataceae bacterium]
MEKRRGIPVSPGVAIGPALVLDTEGVRIPHQTVPPDRVEGEVGRLRVALDEAAAAARASRQNLSTRLGAAFGNIFGAQESLFEDPAFRAKIEEQLRANSFSAEYAVSRSIRDFIKRLETTAQKFGPDAVADARRRAGDLYDVERQVLYALLGYPSGSVAPAGGERVVILANDLMPSDTADFSPRTVWAFATESGGPTSHTAILANALEIPAVVGVGRFLTDVSGGDQVIVDGDRGLLILDPDPGTVAEYEERRVALLNRADRFHALRDKPSVTHDGTPIRLLGNIELAHEAAHCAEWGAEGVGLYRSEFLYLNKAADPTEEEHYEAYKSVVETIGPDKPVVIRTLDLGADKVFSLSALLTTEKNPFLGLRSVRLCLRKLDLFRTQLRAILRAAVAGDVRVMFPMISTVDELRKCKTLLNEVKDDLEDAGVPYKRDVRVGTMIEVPSAALMADVLAREVDFFSVGTNDLVQYTLAADRNNENVADLYNPADPAVLRLIDGVVRAGRDRGVEVNVCGEMSGEPLYTTLLVGLGLRQLSATPRKLPEVKRVIRHLTVEEAERVAAQVRRLDTARQATNYLRDHLRRILPEAVD